MRITPECVSHDLEKGRRISSGILKRKLNWAENIETNELKRFKIDENPNEINILNELKKIKRNIWNNNSIKTEIQATSLVEPPNTSP